MRLLKIVLMKFLNLTSFKTVEWLQWDKNVEVSEKIKLEES